MQNLWKLCLLCVFGCLFVQDASAYRFSRTKENGREYHWKRDRFPIKIDVDKGGCADLPFSTVLDVLKQSIGTWNSVRCTVARLEPGKQLSGVKAPKYDGVNLIQFVKAKADWPGVSGQFALTFEFYNLRSGELADTDLILNDWNFKWGTKGQAGEADLQATITHEMGHMLGLGHSSNPGASMFGKANVGETTKRNLNSDDQKAICDLYPINACKEGKLTNNSQVCYNGRVTQVCPYYYGNICRTCKGNTDCPGEHNFCLTLKDGKFCGFDCRKDPCAKGFKCFEVTENKKVIGKNCAPEGLQCQGGTRFPCCRQDPRGKNADCLPGFSCISGQCLKGSKCVKESGTCSSGTQCCSGTVCVDDGTGNKCRTSCLPLIPKCNGGLLCAPVGSWDKGVCVPPLGGKKENETCDDKQGKCEHEMVCHPTEKKCKLLCKVGVKGICPSGHLCKQLSGNIGFCEKETGQKACSKVSDCPTGRVCKNKRCSPCQKNTECGVRQRCVSSYCRDKCSTDTNCPRQHKCSSGTCVPGVACSRNSDCAQGLVCQNRVCTKPNSDKCKADSQCPEGQRCLIGEDRCVPRTCQSDGQCGQGLVCRQNTCQVAGKSCSPVCQSGQECSASGRCLWKIGYECVGDSVCVTGSCSTVEKRSFCTKKCSVTDSKSCPANFFCTELPEIGLGCWPAKYASCLKGVCKPKLEGCGCSSTSNRGSGTGLLFVLSVLLLLRSQRRSRNA